LTRKEIWLSIQLWWYASWSWVAVGGNNNDNNIADENPVVVGGDDNVNADEDENPEEVGSMMITPMLVMMRTQ